MFRACAQLLPACALVMFWLKTPAGCAGTPGIAGGWVGPVARETRAVGSAAASNRSVRVYFVIVVTLTGPIGSPIALLWPKAPLRAVPE